MGFLDKIFKKKDMVYICYDNKDEEIAVDICNILEHNDINCWLKSRDNTNNSMNEILEAISNKSELMLVIFSKNSSDSKHVNAEVDTAFTNKIPICTLKIEDLNIDGGLEYFLHDASSINVYPDYKNNYDRIIFKTLELLGRSAININLPKTSKSASESEDNFTHDIYIAYSVKDTDAANELCKRLESSGFKCWIAPRDIHTGKNYAEEIDNGIINARTCVLLFTQNALDSIYVQNEMKLAFSKEKTIVSFRIDNAFPNGDIGIYLRNTIAIDAVGDFNRGCSELVSHLSDMLNAGEIIKSSITVESVQSCLIDENINISGVLTDENANPIIGKTVIVKYADNMICDVSTGDDGSYTVSYAFTEDGIKKIEVIYEGDRNFMACEATMNIEVSKIKSEITLSAASDIVDAGEVIALSGRLKAESDAITQANVNVYSNNELVDTIVTSNSGKFSIIIHSENIGKNEFKVQFNENEKYTSCCSVPVTVEVVDAVTQIPTQDDAVKRPFPAYDGEEKYVFVSYAHKDRELVFPEIKKFHTKGYPIWYDDGLVAGQEWDDEIAEALLGCSLLVVFITKNSMASTNVQDEIKLALEEKIDIVPIYLEDTKLPPGLRLRLSNKHAIFKHALSDSDYFRDCYKAFGKAKIPKIIEGSEDEESDFPTSETENLSENSQINTDSESGTADDEPNLTGSSETSADEVHTISEPITVLDVPYSFRDCDSELYKMAEKIYRYWNPSNNPQDFPNLSDERYFSYERMAIRVSCLAKVINGRIFPYNAQMTEMKTEEIITWDSLKTSSYLYIDILRSLGWSDGKYDYNEKTIDLTPFGGTYHADAIEEHVKKVLMCVLNAGYRIYSLSDSFIENLAVFIHNHYNDLIEKQYREKIENGEEIDEYFQKQYDERKPFEELSSRLKMANIRQARNILIKLSIIGCELADFSDEREAVNEFSEEEVETMAIFDHNDWCEERKDVGWVYGEQQDAENLVTPYLVEWNDLTEAIREFDREPVRKIPSLMQSIGKKVVRNKISF